MSVVLAGLFVVFPQRGHRIKHQKKKYFLYSVRADGGIFLEFVRKDEALSDEDGALDLLKRHSGIVIN